MIKNRSKLLGIQLKDMLFELDLNKNMLSNMYNGSMPKADNLAKIAQYLDCSVEYLLGIDKKKPIPEDGDGLDEGALEQEFMRWFRMQPLDRQKEILFDLVQAVPGPGQGE